MPDQLDPNNGEVTDNHNLPKIPELDQDYADEWGFVYNRGEFADGSDAGSDSLLDALEERVTVVDTEANRSNYTAYTDALFVASDTGRLFIGDGTDWTRRPLVENVTRRPIAQLEGAESYEIPIRVADTETLEVYRWGAYDVSTGGAPTGLDVELVDGSDTVQTAANTANSQNAVSPVASYQNASGSLSVFKLRANNTSGSDIVSPGVGMHFAWVVV
jgi:hypothetical protein